MANAPKKKGTAAETELRRRLEQYGIHVHRTSAGALWDLEREGADGLTVNALATRPDRGQWLVTMDLATFAHLVSADPLLGVRIEVKRYARFALHTIWNAKFGLQEEAMGT